MLIVLFFGNLRIILWRFLGFWGFCQGRWRIYLDLGGLDSGFEGVVGCRLGYFLLWIVCCCLEGGIRILDFIGFLEYFVVFFGYFGFGLGNCLVNLVLSGIGLEDLVGFVLGIKNYLGFERGRLLLNLGKGIGFGVSFF